MPEHRVHLDKKPVQGGVVTQSSGTWLWSQSRAAEDGRGHLLTTGQFV